MRTFTKLQEQFQLKISLETIDLESMRWFGHIQQILFDTTVRNSDRIIKLQLMKIVGGEEALD